MNHQPVNIPAGHGIDWKGIGYSISILSVFLLGAVAWPKPHDPSWHLPLLVGGMIAAILGYAVRYMAHLKQKQEIEQAKRKADAAVG